MDVLDWLKFAMPTQIEDFITEAIVLFVFVLSAVFVNFMRLCRCILTANIRCRFGGKIRIVGYSAAIVWNSFVVYAKSHKQEHGILFEGS